jgi:hypothetical protein
MNRMFVCLKVTWQLPIVSNTIHALVQLKHLASSRIQDIFLIKPPGKIDEMVYFLRGLVQLPLLGSLLLGRRHVS